jgi:hypothetical protein
MALLKYTNLSVALAWLAGAAGLHAQWTTQSIPLRPGWNAVFLEVQPEPRECDTVFATLPVERVVAWNRRFSPVQFIQDPNTVVITDPDWLTYLPPAHPLASESSLFTLEVGRVYLIKLRANAQPTTWALPGLARVPKPEWLSDSLNLVGFPVDRLAPPSFATFFASSPAHAGNPVYRLDAAGRWTSIQNLSAVSMQPREAFWIKTTGPSQYEGPFRVVLEQARRLDYGRTLTEQTLRIQNASTLSRTFVVKPLVSAGPPSGSGYAALAGEVPLSYWVIGTGGWANLSGPITCTVPPGGEWHLRLAVRRKDIVPFTPPPGASGALYQSLLEVTDTAGSLRHVLPVTAEGLNVYSSTPAATGGTHLRGMNYASNHPRAGLWVGNAVVNQVSQPASGNPTNPLPTASEFQFRLLIHIDQNERARLLQRVLQMWKDGTYKPDPADPTKKVVDVPGRYVLLTDEQLAAHYTGATLRDGQPVGRRWSTTAFGFREPILMDGVFGESGAALSCTTTLDYDDPLNPFKHSCYGRRQVLF